MYQSIRLYQHKPNSSAIFEPTNTVSAFSNVSTARRSLRGAVSLGSCNKLRAGCPRQYRQLAGRSWARRCLNNPQGTLLIDSSLLRHKCD